MAASPFSEGITQNNTVNLLTSLTMETLIGGYGDTSTDNTLNVGVRDNTTNYDSYLNSGVHDWGDSSYFSGGFFAKQNSHDGLYYEASLRAGQVKADYTGHLATGLTAWYETNSYYIAGHAKVSKIFTLKNADTVNAYFKYLIHNHHFKWWFDLAL